ncbi:hypothetical protein YC2023_114811 [Brassica napus]
MRYWVRVMPTTSITYMEKSMKIYIALVGKSRNRERERSYPWRLLLVSKQFISTSGDVAVSDVGSRSRAESQLL